MFAVSVGIVALTFAVTSVSAQSGTTYQPNYHPGNIVTISRSGWAPSATITLVISESPAINPDVSLTATTDGSGSFMNEDFTVPDNAAGSNFSVTVSDSTGTTRQVTFAKMVTRSMTFHKYCSRTMSF